MLNILVCDDNQGWRDDLCEWIKDAVPAAETLNIEVIACGDYVQARRLLDSRPWQLLITDICGLTTPPGASLPEPDRMGSVLAQQALAKSVPTFVVSIAKHTNKELDALANAAAAGRFRAFDKSTFNLSEFQQAVASLLFGPAPSSKPPRLGPAHNSKQVFVCHGRNLVAVAQLNKFLSYVGLEPTTFRERLPEQQSSFALDVVKKSMADAAAVIVLFTPDDTAQQRQASEPPDTSLPKAKSRQQPRANVLFEAGLALGIDDSRTILVAMGMGGQEVTTLLSNLGGRQPVELTNELEGRRALRARLHHLQCPVSQQNLELGDRALAGDFELPFR